MPAPVGIKVVALPQTQYVREVTDKSMIFLHHTGGGSSPYGPIEGWAGTPEQVATSFIIAGRPPSGVSAWRDGQIIQCFSSNYWAYHLGLVQSRMPPKSRTPTELHKASVGIEICNWGFLSKRSSGSYINSVGARVPERDVLDLGCEYRGYRYWHAYTDEQIESVRVLLMFLCERWNIPTAYKGDSMFHYDLRALKGEPGIWTHSSVRKDKTDCSPQPKLIAMLKSL